MALFTVGESERVLINERAHAPDRNAAVARLRQAIAATRLSGVHSNLGFQAQVLADAEFAAGGFDTGFVARFLERRT